MKVKELVKKNNGESKKKFYQYKQFKSCKKVIVDLERWEIIRDDQVYELDEPLYNILNYFIKNEGRVIRYNEFEEFKILGASDAAKWEDGGKILCVHVGRLRRLLEKEIGNNKVIINKRNIGYKLSKNWRQEVELIQ